MTRFLPLDQNVQVEIISTTIPEHLQEFVTACHKSTFRTPEKWSAEEILAKIGEGKTLWQCMEIIKFGVRCTNVSRVLTHQMVRARVGISYSQQCTGDVDCRHLDFVMPNSYLRTIGDNLLGVEGRFVETCLAAKAAYVDYVDHGNISIQEARYLLPMGLAGHIYLDVCLGSLAEIHRKRMCTMTQTWEFVVWSRLLRKQIERVAPWALPLFPEACGNCWFKQTAKTPFANTHLWYPDREHHSIFDSPLEADNAAALKLFVHEDKTHEEVSSGPKGPIQHYHGRDSISKEEYGGIADTYQLH